MRSDVKRVLVVDDSSTMRNVICDALSKESDFEVVGTASDGVEAVEKHEELLPDIVTLDLQLPRMEGLDALDAIIESRPTAVIVVSSLTKRSVDITMQALERGAFDYIPKPDACSCSEKFLDMLLRKLRASANADVRRVLEIRKERMKQSPCDQAGWRGSSQSDRVVEGFHDSCVAIGVSTGGPPALACLFERLVPPLPPIVIVQHMPEAFTGSLAARLDACSEIKVIEAQGGEVLRPNQALLAPGGKHLRLVRAGTKVVTEIDQEQAAVSGHKPSVDVTMRDAAAVFSGRCIGVIMTGMGFDGVAGCEAVSASGGLVLGQDESSSDVYGMNKAAFKAGHVDIQFSLDELHELIATKCSELLGGISTGV
ncbi:MAG: chemotaxis response regulator protein-glutamate methylesterase [Planctomycetota bacterium]|nr:chemotaxis response regulator protein-glutamate methylesterase [Planctomycetota bacterium]